MLYYKGEDEINQNKKTVVEKKLKKGLTKHSQQVTLFKRDNCSQVFSINGGNMNTTKNYTTYTGTFVKQNGESRTMTFIKGTDVPSGVFKGTSGVRKLNEGYEVVFDINAGGVRMFNWNTVKGIVSQGTTSFNFGNVKS
tara:strand:+ start:493 stop:909 length:417 start_codon:yes stop_codon:yes gene_type:complete